MHVRSPPTHTHLLYPTACHVIVINTISYPLFSDIGLVVSALLTMYLIAAVPGSIWWKCFIFLDHNFYCSVPSSHVFLFLPGTCCISCYVHCSCTALKQLAQRKGFVKSKGMYNYNLQCSSPLCVAP